MIQEWLENLNDRKQKKLRESLESAKAEIAILEVEKEKLSQEVREAKSGHARPMFASIAINHRQKQIGLLTVDLANEKDLDRVLCELGRSLLSPLTELWANSGINRGSNEHFEISLYRQN